jgi:hypothetical protein
MADQKKNHWQPIDTAPKDGSLVLFWSAKAGLGLAWWKTETREYWVRVSPDLQERRLKTDGWWEGMDDEALDATHWQIPEPPHAT